MEIEVSVAYAWSRTIVRCSEVNYGMRKGLSPDSSRAGISYTVSTGMNQRTNPRTAPVFALALLWGAATSSGTVVPRLSADDLVQGSEFIFQARVVRTWAAWDRSHKYIWTHHELEVQDSMKGAATRTIVVSEPGGSLEGLTQYIAGTPRYLPDEDVVVFLYRTPLGLLRTSGFAQGKFAIRRLAGDSQNRVYTNLEGLSLAELPGKRGSSAGASSSTVRHFDGLSLVDFKVRIRELMQSQNGKEAR